MSRYPTGAIVMWHADTPLEPGWALCDGTLDTPDLTPRFTPRHVFAQYLGEPPPARENTTT